MSFRDRDAFNALVAALTATNEFSTVLFPAPPETSAAVANGSPLALVVPWRWQETADASSGGLMRTVQYFLTLVVRSDDLPNRFPTLDRLSSIAQNTLEGSTLGAGCLPTMTQLRQGEYDLKAPNPESRVVLQGTFTYIIASPNSHDTTP